MSNCMCGAHDCPRCYKGCNDIIKCDCGHDCQQSEAQYCTHTNCLNTVCPACRMCTECQAKPEDPEDVIQRLLESLVEMVEAVKSAVHPASRGPVLARAIERAEGEIDASREA